MITDRLLSHTDQETVRQAVAVLERHSQKRGLARLLPFLGPAFVASVAYIDPGNFATNIQGGAKFGYLLLWVILAANLMAHADPVSILETGYRNRGQPPRSDPSGMASTLGVVLLDTS